MKRIICFTVLFALAALAAPAAQFTLTWSDNSTNETGFTIERAPGLAATSGFVAIANVPANTTTYVDAGLPNSTAYSYRLCAYNAAGKSGYSNTASGTTPPPVPAAPGAPTLTAPPDYVPPVVVVSATLTMQGGQILAANVVATTPES
jgi:phage baseplate assembly protein gpV